MIKPEKLVGWYAVWLKRSDGKSWNQYLLRYFYKGLAYRRIEDRDNPKFTVSVVADYYDWPQLYFAPQFIGKETANEEKVVNPENVSHAEYSKITGVHSSRVE